jgi:Tfp pilus assembly protein PilV
MQTHTTSGGATRSRTARFTRRRLRRRGISLLEVVTALTILGTALLGMAEHSRRYAKSNANSMMLNIALDHASGQVERVKAQRNYAGMNLMAGTTSSGSYTIVTAITQTVSSAHDYKTVTVTVTHPAMPKPVKKTTAVARF